MLYIERLPFNHEKDDLKAAVGLSSSDDIKIPEDPKEVTLSKLLRLTATAVYAGLASATSSGNSSAALLLQALSIPGEGLKDSHLVERIEELLLRLAEAFYNILTETQPDTPDNELPPLAIVTAAAFILENTVGASREKFDTSPVPLTAVN